uniref:F-box domain-containing protein n=1 Tax=Heterosigma akashiwo TaxID=2829 RepID=A0A6V1KJC2_HETAK|mmetsp:Transcript_9582/g.16889  ORF Transcript_9582/g.16889 Transcript_9582/m.16889 type:complete len:288 (+) Transcript_9582:260-1123(+)
MLLINDDSGRFVKKSKSKNLQRIWKPLDLLEDQNVFSSVLQFCGCCWTSLRAVSKRFKDSVDSFLRLLVVRPGASKKMVLVLVGHAPKLSTIVLDGVDAVDNEVLHHIITKCNHLTYLSVAYCQNFDASVFRVKPNKLKVNIHGCWKLLSPHPMMSPITVIENQLLAFKATANVTSCAEGLEKALSYMSPSRKSQLEGLFSPVLQNRFQPLTSYKSFFMRKLDLTSRLVPGAGAAFLVSVDCGERVHDFLWLLSFERSIESLRGCWLTDLIYPIERPPVSVQEVAPL